YEISRGERHKLTGIAFDGNKYFDNRLLAGRLQIEPASFGARGRFSHNLVRDDTNSIRDLYHSNGFLDAKLTSEAQSNYLRKKGNIFVSCRIQEGPQTRVGGLEMQGNHGLSEKDLTAVVGSTPGQPYSEANVASDRTNILALYFNAGFPNALCEAA